MTTKRMADEGERNEGKEMKCEKQVLKGKEKDPYKKKSVAPFFSLSRILHNSHSESPRNILIYIKEVEASITKVSTSE